MIAIRENNSLKETHCDFLKSKLERRIEKVAEKDKISIKDKNIIIDDEIKSCLFCIKSNLNKILTANTHELRAIIKCFELNYPSLTKKYKEKKEQPPIYTIVYNIFVTYGYDNYLSEVYDTKQKNRQRIKVEKEYHAYKFVKELGVDCCPYCNRSYISFVKNKDKQTRPQLDHFYPKAIYPFLACSFYNLIPSCSACNHMKSDDDSYKDEKDGTLINPYDVLDNDFTFSYTLNDLKLPKITNKKNIKFYDSENVKITLDTKYTKNDEYFQLNTIYQNHKDIVIELILKEINYPKSYIEELIKNGFGTEEEIYRFLFSNYLELDDLHKRPLSKLTRDIVRELDILYKIEMIIEEKKTRS